MGETRGTSMLHLAELNHSSRVRACTHTRTRTDKSNSLEGLCAALKTARCHLNATPCALSGLCTSIPSLQNVYRPPDSHMFARRSNVHIEMSPQPASPPPAPSNLPLSFKGWVKATTQCWWDLVLIRTQQLTVMACMLLCGWCVASSRQKIAVRCHVALNSLLGFSSNSLWLWGVSELLLSGLVHF